MSDDAPFPRKDFAALVRDLLGFVGTGVGGNTALTDTTEGSVVRTLMEAFAREMAVAYDQLGTVYRQAYLDTAEGVALDNVVALLGLERHGAGHVEGRAVFARRQPLDADVSIPAGTLVAGRDVPLFETTRAEVKAFEQQYQDGLITQGEKYNKVIDPRRGARRRHPVGNRADSFGRAGRRDRAGQQPVGDAAADHRHRDRHQPRRPDPGAARGD